MKTIDGTIIPYLDVICSVSVVILLFALKSDIVVIAVFAAIFPYLLITRRKRLILPYILSVTMALTWRIIANSHYRYNHDFIRLFGFSLFPFFAWSVGLFSLFLIYNFFQKMLKLKKFYTKLSLFISIYWFLLIIVETLAYHVFNIRNIAGAQYSGLPLCDCIHMPLWMKFAYFSIGILYFCLVYFLKLHYTTRPTNRSRYHGFIWSKS